MHTHTFAFALAAFVGCGSLVAAAPATEPTPADSSPQSVAEQLDKLIVTQLKPAEPGLPEKIRIRAVLVDPSTGRPATQPSEIQIEAQEMVLDFHAAQARKEREQAAERQRLSMQEQAVLADVQRQIVLDHEQSDGTYLGIGVQAPDETLREQLSLPPAAGLVVNYVDENGPAKSAIQLHDVLQKLDDQLLINGEQLVALVRMHKQGEAVHVTLLRRAKPVTVEVNLGRRGTSIDKRGMGVRVHPSVLQPFRYIPATPPPPADYTVTWNRELGFELAGQPAAVQPLQGPRITTFNDGELLVSLTDRGELVATNPKDGRILYHGPIGTDKDWDAMPAVVRDHLAKWRAVIAPGPARDQQAPHPNPQ